MTGDPEPRPGTALPRWYPDAAPGRQPPSGRESTAWWLRRADGSAATVEVAGPALAQAQLKAVLQALFAEAAGGAGDGHAADDRPVLRVTWHVDGQPAGTAELLGDGRLFTDDGSGRRLDRRLDAGQLRDVRQALAAAAVLQD